MFNHYLPPNKVNVTTTDLYVEMLINTSSPGFYKNGITT